MSDRLSGENGQLLDPERGLGQRHTRVHRLVDDGLYGLQTCAHQDLRRGVTPSGAVGRLEPGELIVVLGEAVGEREQAYHG
ncbi:hypothetical protein MIU24_02630 [Streptomyces venezuelae]|uniref:hypothetical protein n=1 Tax=Streptomyces sp. B6(2022) TaxID=3404749 RepID=UPI00311ED057